MKRVIINTLERAVSSDINRLQQFSRADFEEMARWLFDAASTDEGAGGDAVVGSILGTPLRATVINGLTVRPDLGSTNTLIDPGVLAAVCPQGTDNADDDVLKLVMDPGIPAGSPSVQLTANSSGSTRIDVVECQVSTTTPEFDSRDTYNPITGLFLPASVPKVTLDGLTYRIRLGTPGAGFPGSANGWLPLMVSLVPTGATSWDDCTMWDVRPLAADRVRQPYLMASAYPGHGPRAHASWKGVPTPNALPYYLEGFIEGATPDGYRCGGLIVPHDGLVGLDLVGNAEPGFAGTNGRPWYLYLAAPFSLPRWARYTDVSSGARKPATLRGIPVFTQTKTPNAAGVPSAALAMPTSLGGTTSNAKLVLAGIMGNVTPSTPVRGIMKGPMAEWRRDAVGFTPVHSSATNGDITFETSLTPGIHYPLCVGRMRVRFYAEWSSDITTENSQPMTCTFSLLDSNGDEMWNQTDVESRNVGTSIRSRVEKTWDFALPWFENSVITASITFSWGDTVGSTGHPGITDGPTFEILGWELF